MLFLYILGVFALLIFLLLMTNVKVHVKSDGDLSLRFQKSKRELSSEIFHTKNI